jgi:argininosuccinate lyase
MSVLWDKEGVQIDARIQSFLAAEDAILDRQILPWDIMASQAHVAGLHKLGVLSLQEAQDLDRELQTLAADVAAGTFLLDERFEDGHSAIEARLTERLGAAGRKVHTGRSRNDQVQVAMRLFLLDNLKALAQSCLEIAQGFLARARRDEHTPMPGYTHLQRAVPSSVGLWLAGFAEAFCDNAALAWMSHQWMSTNPLGTAAGYGVNLKLERDLVGQHMGLPRLQRNPMYVQNSRGRFELQTLMALSHPMLSLRRFAWDLSLYTTSEFGFVKLPPRYTTGSSIMPNKRNPDVVELLRASYATVQGAMSELQAVLALPSGYHRDLQAAKPPTLRALRHGQEALALLPGLLDAMELDHDRMRQAISPEMYATDLAVELAVLGVPFRDAYKRVAQSQEALGQRSPEQSLQARTSPGACADLGLDAIEAQIQDLKAQLS